MLMFIIEVDYTSMKTLYYVCNVVVIPFLDIYSR